MSEHRFCCSDCGEPQALEPDVLCPDCEEAEELLEQYILAEHDAEIGWGELTAKERGRVQTTHISQFTT